MRWPMKPARRRSISPRSMHARLLLRSPSGGSCQLLADGRSRDRSRKMRETVIVEAVRTAVGKRNGGLSTMHAADLSAIVLSELAQRTGIRPEIVDDVVWGCVSQV